METLPRDVLATILGLAAGDDIKDVPALEMVCRQWREILESDEKVAKRMAILRSDEHENHRLTLAIRGGFWDVMCVIGYDKLGLNTTMWEAGRHGHVHIVQNYAARCYLPATESCWLDAVLGAMETDQIHIAEEYLKQSECDPQNVMLMSVRTAIHYRSERILRLCLECAPPSGARLGREWRQALHAGSDLATNIESYGRIDWQRTMFSALLDHDREAVRFTIAHGAEPQTEWERAEWDRLQEQERPLKRQRT